MIRQPLSTEGITILAGAFGLFLLVRLTVAVLLRRENRRTR